MTSIQSETGGPDGGDWFDRLPKVELHVHLEGSIPLDALWKLVRKYGGDPETPDLAALERRFTYRDFPHFIECWIWKNGFLREYEDFTLIAEAAARNFARQNIRYVEAFYSPPDFIRHGLKTGRLTEAVRRGLDRVPAVEVALVADLVRDFGPERAAATLAEAADLGELGVIGIGLGGSEQEFPPAPFAGVFREARARGLKTTVHAGEALGAGSVRDAVELLRADRIGHATRAEEDPALVELLAERRIPLELCPLSNCCTGVIPTLDRHPARRYFERGLPVTVNTDDPAMFGNSLAGEYRALVSELGFSREDVRRLVLNAVDSCWLADREKHELTEALRGDPAWSEHD